ncbi:MAG: hypothetical protein N2255_05775, partial [Kiritimatiellae bacterium]|nr:hypothetical protein [Kiritimatiellia bacterium]
SILQAYHVYTILFARKPTLDGLCRTGSKSSKAWPRCPHAGKGYYEKVASAPKLTLEQQAREGEKMAGRHIWAMVRPRTRAEMQEAKKESADFIMNKATRLFLRPSHLLCILCSMEQEEPFAADNLVELRKRMERDPDIPVTITEGCCVVCPPCNVYHPVEHLCYHGHFKNALRDLRLMEKLGIVPGTTMPARELYRLIYRKVRNLKEVCGWGDGSDYSPLWAPCKGYDRPVLENARRKGMITGRPVRGATARSATRL